MNNLITIEDFKKVDLRIGEVKSINKDKIKILCNNKEFQTKIRLNVKEKDKIVIIVNENELIIPTVNDSIPLLPEKDLPAGSKIH